MSDRDFSDSSDSDDGLGPEELDDGYGDIHKLILQGFMAAGFLKLSGVKELFQTAHKQLKLEMDDKDILIVIRDMIHTINGRINRFNLTIKSADCEITGKRAYMFAVTVESDIMKNQVLFTKFEVEVFKRCLDLFLRQSPDFTASSMDCVNLCLTSNVKGSLPLAEAFVNKMIDQQYLIKYSLDSSIDADDWNLTLGARAICELEPTILELYPEILVSCGLCKKYLLHGYKCPGRRCDYFLHMPCCKSYLQNADNCPKCKKTWKIQKMIKRKRERDDDTSSDNENENEVDSPASSVQMNSDEEQDTQLTPVTEEDGNFEEMDTQLTPVPLNMNSDEEQEDTQLTPVPEEDNEAETQLTPVPVGNFGDDDGGTTTAEDSS